MTHAQVLLSVSLALIIGLPPLSAQDSPKTTSDSWRKIKHEAGNFSAEFPGEAKRTDTKDMRGWLFTFATYTDPKGAQFTVGSAAERSDQSEAELLEMFRTRGLARTAKEIKKIKLGDHPGMEFSVKRTVGSTEQIFWTRAYAVKNVMYTLSVIGAPDAPVPEESVRRFFDSFELLGENARPAPAAANGVDPKNNPMPKEAPVVKLPVVEEKFVPGKSLFDPKVAAAERAMIPQMRALPRPGERHVESLGTLPAPFAQQAYAWSPDGKRFAVAGAQENWILDVATGRVTKKLAGNGETGYRSGPGLRFSADGKKLVSHTRDVIRLTDTDTGVLLREFATPGPTLEAALSEDGSTVTAAMTSKAGSGVMFGAWNIKDGTRKHLAFPENDNFVWCFAPNGNHLIVARRKVGMADKPNPPVEAWNVLNGHRSVLPVRHSALHLSMNEDGRTLVVTTAWSADNKCDYHAVDMVTGEDRKIYTGQSPSSPGRLTPDGKYLLTETPFSPSLVIRLIDARTGKEVWSQEIGVSSNYLMSPGGAFFVRTLSAEGENELDVLAVDDLANPKWAELAGAMDKVRKAGFAINPYGNHLRARGVFGRFNKGSLSELAKQLPQTTIVEFRELRSEQDIIANELAELAKLPGLERVEGRQPFGNDPKVGKALGELKNLKAVELTEDDPILEFLQETAKLEELSIRVDKNFGDAQLKHVFAARSLRSFKVTGPGVKMTDKGFEGIGELRELRHISTRGGSGRITSRVFAHWRKCPKLESVELLEAEMFDKDLADLAAMPQLTRLCLQPVFALPPTYAELPRNFTEAGIESLAPLKNLRWLRIDASDSRSAKALKALDLRKLETGRFDLQFADEDMPILKSMTGLQELWLPAGPYTDKGLDELRDMTHLWRLHITDRKEISDAKVRELQKALPGTVILRTN